MQNSQSRTKSGLAAGKWQYFASLHRKTNPNHLFDIDIGVGE